MCNFMRVLLSGAMKDNKHCHLGIMTDVPSVAKEGLFHGLTLAFLAILRKRFRCRFSRGNFSPNTPSHYLRLA